MRTLLFRQLTTLRMKRIGHYDTDDHISSSPNLVSVVLKIVVMEQTEGSNFCGLRDAQHVAESRSSEYCL